MIRKRRGREQLGKIVVGEETDLGEQSSPSLKKEDGPCSENHVIHAGDVHCWAKGFRIIMAQGVDALMVPERGRDDD